jgi:hypothetical protein
METKATNHHGLLGAGENRCGVESVLTISRILVSMLGRSRQWREVDEVEDGCTRRAW